MANLQSTNIYGTLKVNSITPATASNEGAFVVLGGAGIGGNLYVGGKIYSSGGEGVSVPSINNIVIVSPTEGTKTLDVSNASLFIGGAGQEGSITITSNNETSRILTLETSPTIKALTKDHVLFASADNTISGEAKLAISRGGTNINTYAKGDLLYASGANVLDKLTIGGAGKALVVSASGGVPEWSTGTLTLSKNLEISTGNVKIVGASAGTTLTLPASLTVGALSNGAVLFADGANTIGGESQLAISRGGTGKSSINPKYALLGPATGEANGSPSWRAITSADISDATNDNDASTIVKRDSSGNFTANIITADLTGNASTATTLKNTRTLWGQSFNGGGNITGNISNSGNITPSETDTKDLGSSTLKYKDAFLSGALNANSVSTLGNVSVGGNLTVTGTTYFKHESNLKIADKNIELGVVEGEGGPNNATANGGGITLKGGTTDGDKTIIWDSTNKNWTSSEHWNLASGKEYKINNASVLSSTTLGTSVLTSSLTSVGDLKTVTVVDVSAKAKTNKIKIAPENTSTTNKTITISTYTSGYTGDRTYTLPDAGKNALFVMTEGDQTINGVKTFSGNITGNLTGNVTGDLTGNADTVTNGIYTTGSYSDPSWLSISKTKVGLSNVENTSLSTWAGTTNITTVGAVSATSINDLTLTSQATGFTIAGGTTSKTLTVNNTITLSGTDGKTLNIGDGGTLDTGAFAPAYDHPTGGGGSLTGLSGATVISGITVNSLGHVTGTATRSMTLADLGALSNSDTSAQTGAFGSIKLKNTATTATFLTIQNTDNTTTARTLSIKTNDADRAIKLSGNLTLASSFTTSGNYTLTLTTTGETNVTLPTSGTLINSSDSRLTDSRTPKSHTHGDVTDSGFLGSAGNQLLITSNDSGNVGKITTLATSVSDDGKVLKVSAGVPVWSTEYSYGLPTASSSTLGGVKIGSGITITSGVISVSTNYQAPLSNQTGATQNILNGSVVRGLVQGDNITITESGNLITISATDTKYTAGTGISLDDGTKAFSINNTVVATLADSQTFTGEKNFSSGLSAPNVKVGKFTWQYNSTEDSMDLVYTAT